MRIYIVRHGKAADEGYKFDEDRPLTDEGRSLMRVTAKAWVDRGDVKPEIWLSSPLVRAVQTCEICVDAFGLQGPVEITRTIVPEGQVSKALDLVHELGVDTIALVSHEPFCSTFASHLVGDDYPRPFKKGANAALDLTGPGKRATVAWHLEPAKAGRDPVFHP